MNEQNQGNYFYITWIFNKQRGGFSSRGHGFKPKLARLEIYHEFFRKWKHRDVTCRNLKKILFYYLIWRGGLCPAVELIKIWMNICQNIKIVLYNQFITVTLFFYSSYILYREHKTFTEWIHFSIYYVSEIISPLKHLFQTFPTNCNEHRNQYFCNDIMTLQLPSKKQ